MGATPIKPRRPARTRTVTLTFKTNESDQALWQALQESRAASEYPRTMARHILRLLQYACGHARFREKDPPRDLGLRSWPRPLTDDEWYLPSCSPELNRRLFHLLPGTDEEA